MSSPDEVAVSAVDPVEASRPPAPRWPWLMLAVALPLVGGAVLHGLRIWSERQQEGGIASATLADGSRIIVEEVSVGRVHNHVLKRGTRISFPILRSFGYDPVKSTLTTNADRILIFFRHVGRDGKAHDLHWWRAHATTADDDEELWDDEGTVLYLTEQTSPRNWSISSVHGTLGFDTPPPRLEKVVGVVELPVSAFSGPSIPLRLLNEKGETMASLTVPVSLPPVRTVWIPEDLPIRKTFGTVDVALKSVTPEARPLKVRDETRPYYSLDRRWEVTEKGQPPGHWKIVDESVGDEAGENGLPPKGAWKSPVWRLTANLVPVIPDPPPELAALPAAFQGAKEFTSVAVPLRDTMVEVSETLDLTMPESGQAFPLTLERVGAGTTTWTGMGRKPQSHGRGMGSTDTIGPFNVSSSSSSSDWSLTITARGAWLRLTHNRLGDSERLEFAVFDDQRRPLKWVKHPGGRDVTWIHVEPLPDSKQMTLRAYPLRIYPMAFYFTPPRRPRLEEVERQTNDSERN